MARAVANEANCPFLSCSASDFVEMLVGRGAARIRDLFDQARKKASGSLEKRGGFTWPWPAKKNHLNPVSKGSPSAVIFIDEIDALAKSRGGLNGNDEREQTLNQLLCELDGFHSYSGETYDSITIIVIAATNRPEILDKALLRSGRFDRHVYVGCPNTKGREEILLVHAKKVALHSSVSIPDIAQNHTQNFSGADLANVVNEAALLSARELLFEVHQRHMLGACQRVARMKVINML